MDDSLRPSSVIYWILRYVIWSPNYILTQIIHIVIHLPINDQLHLNLWYSATLQFISLSVMSDSLRPHGLQQARLPFPSPTFLSITNTITSSVMSNSLWPHRLYSPWNSPGQNTGVGSLSLFQRIFPTQGSNSGLYCIVYWEPTGCVICHEEVKRWHYGAQSPPSANNET